jgi:hypothetical protein
MHSREEYRSTLAGVFLHHLPLHIVRELGDTFGGNEPSGLANLTHGESPKRCCPLCLIFIEPRCPPPH